MTTAAYNNHFIPVKISNGIFSNEYRVSLNLANGNNINLFADRNLVKETNGCYYLQVALVSQKDNIKLVILPTEPFETSSMWAEVCAES